MSYWTAIVVIVAIWGLVQIISSRHRVQLGYRHDEDDDEEDEGGPRNGARLRERELREEIERLRGRLEVLERIATDAESREARERRRLEAEIDSLRHKE